MSLKVMSNLLKISYLRGLLGKFVKFGKLRNLRKL